MQTILLIITVILVTIVHATSASSPPVCDAYNVALNDNPATTAVSGNGDTIATGGTNGMIGTFTPEGSPRWVHRINDPVTGIATSKDGRFVAAITFGGDLFYFDDTGSLLWNLSGFGCNSHVALSGDGKEGYVFSRSPTHDLTGDTVFHFAGNGSVLSHLPVPGISSYDLSPDNRVAVVNSGESHRYNYIVAIDDTGIRWEKISESQWRVPFVAVSDDCSTVAAAEPGMLTVFSCSGKMLWNTTPQYMAKAVAVSGDGEHIVVGTQYRVLHFNRSGTQLWDYPVPDYVVQIKTSKNGSKIVATTRQTLYSIDGNGTSSWQYSLPDWTDSLSISDTGDLIAAGTYNNTFTILDGRGNAKEIKLDTIPVMPIVTAGPASLVNLSADAKPSQPVPANPLIAIAACVSMGIFMRRRK